MKRRIAIAAVFVAIAAAAASYWLERRPESLVLTGIVTTDEVRVSAQVQGRLQKLLVDQGAMVKKGQLLAVIDPREQQADMKYYQDSEKESSAQLAQSRAELALVSDTTREQIRQAEATLAKDKAQVEQAKADLEYARLSYDRAKALQAVDIQSQQDYDQSRTAFAAAKAHVASLQSEVEAAKAALAQARAGAEQVAAKKAAVAASGHQLAAAGARSEKAAVLLGYTRVEAPINGIIDVRAALQGEVVVPGQVLVTLIDPDDLWVRADVEESYIDRIHLGDKLSVRLPSGARRTCTVFFRGVDADYATQRDVSRTKRDIKTFQIRLRCDNRDRSLALGMTAYVNLPLEHQP